MSHDVDQGGRGVVDVDDDVDDDDDDDDDDAVVCMWTYGYDSLEQVPLQVDSWPRMPQAHTLLSNFYFKI